MKKLFIFLMCIIGYIGSVDAQEIEHYIGAESTRKYSSFPVYEYYNYSMREYIYLAEEMGDGALIGDITSISFMQAEKRADTRKFSVYIVHTDKVNFLNGTDWIPFTEDDCYLRSADIVYPGKDKEWAVLTFDKPFKYEGGNIAIGIFDETGSFKDASKFYSYQTSHLRRCIGHDRDAAPYDPANPNVSGGFYPYAGRNEMPVTRFTFKTEEDFSVINVEPKEIDLSYRPNNAWMEPYEITIGTKGNALTVNAVDVSIPYFKLTDVETPANITITSPMVLELSHGVGHGEIEGQIGISLNIARSLEFVDVKAFAYDPVASDVWETAEAITSYPFTVSPDVNLYYNNYRLPGSATDGKDVVYELNFDRDVALTANVIGDNAKVAVYTEDFNGMGGPSVDNALSTDKVEALGLPAGKYYLVASSTSNFTLNVDKVPMPLPEKPYNPSPADFANNITNPSLSWTFGDYTVEYQLLLGSTYPPKDVVVDWTDNLEVGHNISGLYNNTNYFWQVNVRNSSGTTYGDVWGFTTKFNVPQNLTVLNEEIYEGESSTITWEPVTDRSYIGYNVYLQRNKVNTTPLKETSYTFDNLSYKMGSGHRVEVTAVYDEGESGYSNVKYIKVTGLGSVSGTIYEQDDVTPITTGGFVHINGVDEFGVQQSYTLQVDENGTFSGDILAGEYEAVAEMEYYQESMGEFEVTYNQTTVLNLSVTEIYNPVAYVEATELNDTVQVVWGMQKYGGGGEDFETGDFSANEWNNAVSDYPWIIVEGGNESDYAMKSTCEGVDYGVSAIEITVEVPADGKMSFDYKISSEQAYDLGIFYIDGTAMATFSGEAGWATKAVPVTEGTHTYRWEYSKDVMWENGEDAFYIDNIVFYFEPEPFAGGWLTYDDGVYATSIGTGQQAPCYWGVAFPASTEYAGYTITKVAVFDASPDYAGTYTANIYVGGTDAPGTLVSTQEATLTGTGDFAEIVLSTPVTIDATQTFWITFYTPNITYPAAGCALVDLNSDWISLDGTTWEHASIAYGLEYTWMVRAYLENAKGQTAMLTTSSKAPKFEGGVSTGTFVAAENVTPINVGVPTNNATMAEGTRAFVSYNLYRKNLHTAETVTLLENTSDTSYIDNSWATNEPGAYKWGVSANYAGNRTIQKYFAENFESGVIPEGWTIYNTSAEGHESHILDRQMWKPVQKKSSNAQMFYPAEGNYFLQGDEDGYLTYQGAWDLEYGIITPAIDIMPCSVLEMEYINPSYEFLASWRSNIDVRFSNSIDGPWTTLWSTNNTMAMDWVGVDIDLSEYSGQTGYIMFVHYALSDWGWFAGIDDISITSYKPESEVLWSETIDKDMITSVSVSAQTNNGDPVKGTTVSFINIYEPGLDHIVTLGEDGTYTFDNFRKGTYELTISKDGFTSEIDGVVVDIWEPSSFECMLTEDLAAVKDLYVSPTGWAMWKGRAIGGGDEFEFGFEDGMEGWTTIDANADNHTWYHSTAAGEHGTSADGYSHEGAGHLMSESYCNASWTSMEPDDYVVSPQQYAIGASSTLTFWACAQDMNYKAEHFGVAISTTGNTSASDFTTVAEWTIGQKSEGVTETRGMRDPTTWVQYTVDLSDYAGQSAWIAIRHFDCYDQFILLVDDIALVNANKSDRALVKYQVMLNDVVEKDSLTVPYFQHENLVDGTTYTTTVTAYYTSGVGEAASYTWTKLPNRDFASVKNLSAVIQPGTYDAHISWAFPQEDLLMSYSFDEDLEGWTIINANEDDHTWYHKTESSNHNYAPNPSHSGNGHVMNESYCYKTDARIEPDDYLVSPQQISVVEGTMFSFYACAYDNLWKNEHFGVAVSAAGNTEAADFTTIAEWTVGPRSGEKDKRDTKTPTQWIKYTADLSAYAGQDVWVAIRHFGCFNEMVLCVDDVNVTLVSKGSTARNEKAGRWLHYDDGEHVDGVGGPQAFYWGIKLRAEELSQYAFTGITKVALFDVLEMTDNFYIYTGGENAPEKLVHTQEYSCTGSNEFVEFELTNSIPVYGSENIWIVFHTNKGAEFPASVCGDTGDADGRWISTDGNTWQDLVDVGLSYTWMIRAYDDDDAYQEELIAPIADILGVMIYRNGELLNTQPMMTTSFTDKDGEKGDQYCVQVVYGGEPDKTYYGMSLPRCREAEFTIDCEAPKDLYGEYTYNEDGTFGATLRLSYNPNPIGDWLYYDDGVNQDAIGGPASFYWGIMIPSNLLEAYDGTFLTKVSLFDYAASSGVINIYYGGDNAPGDLVHTQEYSVSGTGQFVEFDLTSALPIDPTMNLWVVYSTGQGTNYPASVSADTGDPNGRWISMDGSVWEDIIDYGLSNTWMIRAYVTNTAKGEVSQLTTISDFEYTASTGNLVKSGVARATNALSHYNVYRGTSANNLQLIGESSSKTYFDEVAEGTYYYQMTAVYADNGEECESAPANSYSNPEQDYVVVDVNAINENGVKGMMIYPNPTQGDLNITAEGMTRIVITNALGQVMYDQEINADNKVINMSQYEGGVYMVRIVTENGVAVERVTVL